MYFKMKLLLEQWNMFYKNMVYHSYKIILCFKKYYKFFPNFFTFFPTLDSHMCIEQSSLWAIHGRAPTAYSRQAIPTIFEGFLFVFAQSFILHTEVSPFILWILFGSCLLILHVTNFQYKHIEYFLELLGCQDFFFFRLLCFILY